MRVASLNIDSTISMYYSPLGSEISPRFVTPRPEISIKGRKLLLGCSWRRFLAAGPASSVLSFGFGSCSP